MAIKKKSATAVFVALSFLQPVPGFAQTQDRTAEIMATDAFGAALACLEGFDGKHNDAEGACLEDLRRAEFACDSSLIALDAQSGDTGRAQGDAPEKIALRITQTVNLETCLALDAQPATTQSTTDQAQIADEAAAVAQLEAQAAAELARLAEAEADAVAQAEADAAAAAQAEAAALAEAEAAAQADADADAAAQADAEDALQAQADATALANSDAAAELAAELAIQATADAEAQAAAQAIKAQETAASEAAAREAARAAECVVELVALSGEVLCADAMTQAEIAAVTADVATETDVAVATETVNDADTRSSQEEFDTPNASESGAGLSNLERAGLLALGAVVVGAILQNGQRVTASTGDRVVVQDEYGNYSILKDDDVLIREAGSTVRTETYADGSTRSFVTRPDGAQIITIRDSLGQVQRRIRIDADGTEVVLIDDMRRIDPVEVNTLPAPQIDNFAYRDTANISELRAALRAAETRDFGRSFSLSQVREYSEVRNLVPEIYLDNITFQTGSASIQPTEAARLRDIGLLMVDYISENPREVFLIEGYTDAIGDESYNLLLSDRRAETVALALSEYFGVRPENLVVQGYGERFPLIPTLQAERLNRRVAVRRITALIQSQ